MRAGIRSLSGRSYYVPRGGHPGQEELLTSRAVFKPAYAVIPRGVMRDIVTSALPFWDKTRAWVLARPTGRRPTNKRFVLALIL